MNADTERLKKLWNGRSQYVEDGNATYRVLTPNGKDNPIFVLVTDSSLYGSLSYQGTEPKTKKPVAEPKKHIVKNTDVGG